MDYLADRVRWAHSQLPPNKDANLLESIELHNPGGLGEQYEHGNVVAYRYAADSLPDDSELRRDVNVMLNMLDRLYQTETSVNRQVVPEPQADEPPPSVARLGRSWLREVTLWPDEALDDLLEAVLGSSPQIILAGPPGTGNTWVAQAVARHLTEDDPARWRLVQFHPSYSYESFVEGLRPVASGSAISFDIVPGVVLRMAKEADSHMGPQILVIDEMNRANLSRVLGELMFLFEYRNQRIDLQYSTDLALPDNLKLIGTMNTADRSIRAIDVALRRRFEVFECSPDVGILERYYALGTHQNYVPDLLDGFLTLNEALRAQLDRHHTIGHTFFMTETMTPDRLQRVWRRTIQPLIEEYFFDMPDVAARFRVEEFWKSLFTAS